MIVVVLPSMLGFVSFFMCSVLNSGKEWFEVVMLDVLMKFAKCGCVFASTVKGGVLDLRI